MKTHIWPLLEDYHRYVAMRRDAVKKAIRIWPTTDITPSRTSEDIKTGESRFEPDHAGSVDDLFFTSQRILDMPYCTPAGTADNEQAIQGFQRRIPLLDEIRVQAEAITSNSISAQTINNACVACDAVIIPTYHQCMPSWTAVSSTTDEYMSHQRPALMAVGHAADILFVNAEREHGKLKQLVAAVQKARLEFETLPKGGMGIAGIDSAHGDFTKQESIVRGFVFGIWKFQSNQERVAAFWASVDQTHALEASFSAITELDRLRNEYVVRNRPVPLPSEFTQTASSQHFTFSQLNTGDYSWAVIRPVLLQKMEEIYSLLTKNGIPVKTNSVYRNPAHQDAINPKAPLSRHQYGDALDWQVFDNNHDGTLKDDWKTFYNLAQQTHPSYTEPMAVSGPGHVHTDWRQLSYLDFSVLDD